MRIGVLSDTHTAEGLDAFGPEPAAFFSSVDLILHTGDIIAPVVLDWLEQFAPLLAVRGNHDVIDDPRMQDLIRFEREGWWIGAVHIADDIRAHPERVERMKGLSFGGPGLDILIAGDSHYERMEYHDRTLLLNSGSALLPHQTNMRLGSVALLELSPERVRAELLHLGESEGLRNPAHTGHIEFDRNGPISASHNGAPIAIEDGRVRWPGIHGPDDQL